MKKDYIKITSRTIERSFTIDRCIKCKKLIFPLQKKQVTTAIVRGLPKQMIKCMEHEGRKHE